MTNLSRRIENLQTRLNVETNIERRKRLCEKLIVMQTEYHKQKLLELRKHSAKVDPDNYDLQSEVDRQLMTMRTIKFDQFLLAALFAVITASCLFVAVETGTKSFWFAAFGTLITTAWFVISGVRENKKSKRG